MFGIIVRNKEFYFNTNSLKELITLKFPLEEGFARDLRRFRFTKGWAKSI